MRHKIKGLLCVITVISIVSGIDVSAYATAVSSSVSSNSVTSGTSSDNLGSDLLKLDKLKTVAGTVSGAVTQSSTNLILNTKTGNATVDAWKSYVQSKAITQDELNAFNWSFIISQFAVPYRDNMIDVLQKSAVFRSMAEQDLVISTNPYTDAKMTNDTGVVNSKIAGNQVTIRSTEFKKIYDTIVANVNYNPVYMKGAGSAGYRQMLVEDFWNDATTTQNVAYIADKKYGYASGDYFAAADWPVNRDASATVSKLKASQEDKNFVSKLKSNEIYIPIWVRSDVSRFYVSALTATFIKYNVALGENDEARVAAGGVKCSSAADLIKLYGKRPVYADNFGNLCMMDGDKYKVVYPNYTNSVFNADSNKLEGAVTLALTPPNVEKNSNPNKYKLSVKLSSPSGGETEISLHNGVNYYSENKELLKAISYPQSEVPISQMWSNESVFEYNKLLHTIYSRVLPQNNTTTASNPVQGIQDLQEYYSNLIGTKAQDMKNYRNNLVFLKAPSVSIWDYEGMLDKSLLDTFKVSGNILEVAKEKKINANLEQNIGGWWNPWQRIFCSMRNVKYSNPLSNWAVFENTDNVYWSSFSLNNGIFSESKTKDGAIYTKGPKGYYAARAMELGADIIATFSYSGGYVVDEKLNKSINDHDHTDVDGIIFTPLPNWTLDYTQRWNIWDDKGNKYSYDPDALFVNRGMLTSSIYYGKATGKGYQDIINNVKNSIADTVDPDEALLHAENISAGSARSNEYEYDEVVMYPTDTRISDRWDDYPKDDVAITSFVWLNYYINQLTVNRLLPVAKKEEGYDYVTNPEDFYGSSVVVYPYEVLNSSGVSPMNETLYYTDSMYDATSGQGYASTEIYRNNTLTIDYHDLLLAIMKNTDYDKNLLVKVVDEQPEAKPMDILNAISQFIQNPITAISNIFLGFFQLTHNTIAVGNAGNIFNTTWIVQDGIMKIATMYYYITIGILITVMLLVRAFRFLTDREASTAALIRDFAWSVVLSILPMMILNNSSVLMNVMSQNMLSEDSSKMAIIDIESDIRSKLNLNANFEQQYQPFRQQFANVGESYKDLAVEQAIDYDKFRQDLNYKNVTLKTLTDNVSYELIMGMSGNDAVNKSATAETMPGVEDGVDTAVDSKDVVPITWYNKEGFMPVHYNQYKDSVFYYFYDYIRYQYLRYYAGLQSSTHLKDLSSEQLTGISTLANQYTTKELVASMTEDTKKQIFGLEKEFLTTCVGGAAYMYNDKDFVYGASYGNSKYNGTYVQDLFGLGYLFDMSNSEKVSVTDTQALSTWESEADKQYTPIAAVMKSPYWEMYSKSPVLNLNKTAPSGSVSQLAFSPYAMRECNSKDTLYRGRGDDSAKADSRVYASRTGLYEDFGVTAGGNSINVTPLENQLMNLNEKMYQAASDIVRYKPNEIRDTTMITAIALSCTFEFNKAFNPSKLSGEVKPQSFAGDTLDMDKALRVMFAKDMGSIAENEEVMYMINDQNFGFISCLVLFFSEIFLVLAVALRAILIGAMFLTLMAFSMLYYVGHGKYRKQILLGVTGQMVVMFVSQFVMIETINVATTLLNQTDSGGWSVLGALALTIVFAAICIISLQMVIIVVKDWRTLGGATFAGVIDSTINRAKASMDGSKVSGENFSATFQNYQDKRDNKQAQKDRRANKFSRIKNSLDESGKDLTPENNNGQGYSGVESSVNRDSVRPHSGSAVGESIVNEYHSGAPSKVKTVNHSHFQTINPVIKSVNQGSSNRHVGDSYTNMRRYSSGKTPSGMSGSKQDGTKIKSVQKVKIKPKIK